MEHSPPPRWGFEHKERGQSSMKRGEPGVKGDWGLERTMLQLNDSMMGEGLSSDPGSRPSPPEVTTADPMSEEL